MYIISVVVLHIYFTRVVHRQIIINRYMKHRFRCQDVTVSKRLVQCQKLEPLHLDRCTGEHTDHSPKATHLNFCMLSSFWARSCFWIGVSTPHQIFPPPLFLFTLYFIIIITIFTFILSKVAYICYFVSSWKKS